MLPVFLFRLGPCELIIHMRLLRLLKRDLHNEARGWVMDGIISESQAEGICNRYGIDYHDQTPHTFSEIDMPEAAEAGGLRWNEVVFVKLRPGKQCLCV